MEFLKKKLIFTADPIFPAFDTDISATQTPATSTVYSKT